MKQSAMPPNGPAQRYETITVAGNDELDVQSCLHNVGNAFAPSAQAVLTGGGATARGIYQGVAQLADRTYWKNRALGIVEGVKFIGSVLAQDAWVENWETEYRNAALTGNQKSCDLLLERFEKHEFQPLGAAEPTKQVNLS